MKFLNIKRAFISAIVIWAFGVAVFVTSYYIPLMDDLDAQANWVLSVALIPAAILGARIYYQKGYNTNGFVLGTFMFLVAMVLDVCITVPLFIFPIGGNHFTFFGNPSFWFIGIEYIGVVTTFWYTQKANRTDKIKKAM